MATLLSVDLGIKTGWALYAHTGKLVSYGSHNFGSQKRLKQGAHYYLMLHSDLAYLVIEGGGPLATIWAREASKRNIPCRQIAAEDWRRILLLPREQRNSLQAKQSAISLAHEIIIWSKLSRPTSLRHDTAEAILIGLWGVLEVGWLQNSPWRVHQQGCI
jgi:hypothetical protein